MSQQPPSGPFDFEALRKMLQQLGLGDEDLNLEDLVAQVQRIQQQHPGAFFPVTNADRDPDAAWLTMITAAKALAAESSSDPKPSPEQFAGVIDAERLAQSWLTPVTSLPETGRPPRAIRRADWLDETSALWRKTIEPIIDGIAVALERGSSAPEAEELLPMQAMMAPMLRQSASLIYRDRLKRELAALACDLLTGTELGFNLLGSADVVLLPTNVAKFTLDLDVEERDVVLYLLLREAARQRLFNSVGWLAPQMSALLRHWASEITIDFDAIAEQFQPDPEAGFSLEDMVKVGEEVRGSFFKPASTDSQIEILERLEVLLALVEGWVDHVVGQATAPWMPNAVQLDETLQRRRASATPVTAVFRELFGLDLRPRLVRDARNLWAAVERERGLQGRDAVWGHPDLLPTAAHLADPMSFAMPATQEESQEDEFDAELRKLLGGTEG